MPVHAVKRLVFPSPLATPHLSTFHLDASLRNLHGHIPVPPLHVSSFYDRVIDVSPQLSGPAAHLPVLRSASFLRPFRYVSLQTNSISHRVRDHHSQSVVPTFARSASSICVQFVRDLKKASSGRYPLDRVHRLLLLSSPLG